MIQRTLVLIKGDAIQRAHVGEILTRFEKAGLKIIGMKMVWIDKDFAKKHYFDVAERHSERVLNSLVDYLVDSPIIAMVLEGVNAIEIVRKLTGSTYPHEAAPGTIRGDFAHISKNYANENNARVSNLVHASSKPEDAQFEIGLWFTDKELHSYKTVHDVHLF